MLSSAPIPFCQGQSCLCSQVLAFSNTRQALRAEFILFPKFSFFLSFFNDEEMEILVFDYCNHKFSIATPQMVNQSI